MGVDTRRNTDLIEHNAALKAKDVNIVGGGTGGGVVTQGTVPWIIRGERSTAGTPAGFTISTAAVLVAASNASRKAILMVNFGSSNIYIGHTNAVTTSGATAGLKLVANGSYQDSGDGLYTGDLYAIGDAVSAIQNLSASERT